MAEINIEKMAQNVAEKAIQELRDNGVFVSRWIPVSEGLPKKDESVLLTICANSSLYGFNENFVKVMCGSYSPCEDKRDWIVNEIRYYIDNVIAWIPLPEPFKMSEIPTGSELQESKVEDE